MSLWTTKFDKKMRQKIPDCMNINQNYQWAQDWIEQISFLKNNSELLSLAENDMHDFCCYTDTVETNLNG
jgi:hypothetical protein